jgi:hypothetical protein
MPITTLVQILSCNQGTSKKICILEKV